MGEELHPPLVSAVRVQVGWVSHCSTHGMLALWALQSQASWDALGHAAAHHSG